MKRGDAVLLMTTVLLFSAGGAHPAESVVTFTNVTGERDGIRAEHAWTEKHFPGYRWKSRRLVRDAQLRTYDRISLVGKGGERATVYFDITNWYVRH